MRIFVYGTLMQGFPNHEIIAKYVEEIYEAETTGKLYAVGGFPGLVEGKGKVEGELLVFNDDFEQEILNKLDRLEGCPHLFERRKKQVVRQKSGEVKEARVYLYNSDNYSEGDVIKSGSWKEYSRE